MRLLQSLKHKFKQIKTLDWGTYAALIGGINSFLLLNRVALNNREYRNSELADELQSEPHRFTQEHANNLLAKGDCSSLGGRALFHQRFFGKDSFNQTKQEIYSNAYDRCINDVKFKH